LEHAYTPAELSFQCPQGADAGVASVLVKAAAEADCDLHLALVSIEESGSAEHTAITAVAAGVETTMRIAKNSRLPRSSTGR